MSEARFLVDSLGEATQDPRFDGCALDVAVGVQQGIEAERIVSAKLAVWGSRALRRAQVRMDEGLLLEAAPEDREATERASLVDLPTEEFEVVAEKLDPTERQRVRAERQERKTVIDRSTPEGKQRWGMRLDEARQRLEGRPASSGKRPSGRKKR